MAAFIPIVARLAPLLLSLLQTQGLPAETRADGTSRRALSSLRIQVALRKLAKSKGGKERIQELQNRFLGRLNQLRPGGVDALRKEAGASYAMGPRSRWGKMVKSPMMGNFAGQLAMIAPFMAMSYFMGGEGEAAGEEALGAENADMANLLQVLQAQEGNNMDGGGPDSDLMSDYGQSQGAVDFLQRRQLLSSRPSSLGAGVGDLETIIRGNEELLQKISHNEPLTLTQAYAMKGLYGGGNSSPESVQSDFRDLET